MIAIIKEGGKQYLIKEGSIITVNKIEKQEGEDVVFDKVLLFDNGEKTILGKPYIDNIFIRGRVLKNFKTKILIIKFKPKTRYRKKLGFKNYFTQIKIEEIKLN
ncbi:MAG: 50S ribosomal protein L21 [Candidatus Parcubacteria bacterium]|nr:MAG: 50S ribosomal protein L21 [Candidatus Parcubacteria bacterium]